MTATSNDTYLEPQIDEYIQFLNSSNSKDVKVLRKERVKAKLPLYVKALNTFLTYPDILADIMTPKNSTFSMFFAQRFLLRCMARHRQTFATFTRAFSKSFLADYYSFVKSMIVPHCNGFVAAATGKQAAQIIKEKFSGDLWIKFPLMKNEMKKRNGRAAYIQGEDYAEMRFTNNSRFDVIGGHPRGGRRNYGVFEEIIEQDPTKVNEELIPLMNSPRTTNLGKINSYEKQGQKMYITTAGYQQTFAYDKCIETLCYSVLDPDNYICLGGSYIIPLMHGRLEEQTMREIMSSPSFDKDSLEREYISHWSGAKSGAVFGTTTIASLRKVVRAEWKAAENLGKDFYVVTADMAKDGSADTAVIIYRVSPREYMFYFKCVNLFTISSTDYEIVANELKKAVMSYNARLLVYDANGIGAALRDWLNKPTVDKSGTVLPGFGIINPPQSAEKDILRYPKEQTICYEIKSGGLEGQRIHKVFISRISNGSVKFLIKTNEALLKFQQNKSFLAMSTAKQRKQLDPYKFMDLMEKELKNLIIVDTADNITNTMKIDRIDKKIQKDFFSAGEYGVYATNQVFELDYYNQKRKKGSKLSGAVFIS